MVEYEPRRDHEPVILNALAAFGLNGLGDRVDCHDFFRNQGNVARKPVRRLRDDIVGRFQPCSNKRQTRLIQVFGSRIDHRYACAVEAARQPVDKRRSGGAGANDDDPGIGCDRIGLR